MKPVHVGILGLGTVGCGTANVLSRNSEEIARRAGRQIIVKRAAVRDIRKKRNLSPNAVELTDDAYAILDDPQIDVVVESIGGESPAYDYVARATTPGTFVVPPPAEPPPPTRGPANLESATSPWGLPATPAAPWPRTRRRPG